LNEYVKTVDGLPLIVRVLLAFFIGPIVYGIYRIAKGSLILGVIWIITGGIFGIGWLIDFVMVILHGKPTILV
jgi:hypothetical protein